MLLLMPAVSMPLLICRLRHLRDTRYAMLFAAPERYGAPYASASAMLLIMSPP